MHPSCIMDDLNFLNERLSTFERRLKAIESVAVFLANRESFQCKLNYLEKESRIAKNEGFKILDHISDSDCFNNIYNAMELNKTLRKSIHGLLDVLDDNLCKEKLTLQKVISDETLRLNLPTFDGTNLPLFHTFYTNFTNVCDLGGLPNRARIQYLLKSIVGKASNVVLDLGLNEEVNYDALVSMLSQYFNDWNRQREVILKLQSQIEPLTSLSEDETSGRVGYKFFTAHLKILSAVKSIQQQFIDGVIEESPLTEDFLTCIETPFPRDVTFEFFSASGSPKASSERFRILFETCEKYKKLFWREIKRSGLQKDSEDSPPQLQVQVDITNRSQNSVALHPMLDSVRTIQQSKRHRKRIRRKPKHKQTSKKGHSFDEKSVIDHASNPGPIKNSKDDDKSMEIHEITGSQLNENATSMIKVLLVLFLLLYAAKPIKLKKAPPRVGKYRWMRAAVSSLLMWLPFLIILHSV